MRVRKIVLTVVCFLVFLGMSGPVLAAMTIQGYDETLHDRFYVGGDKAFIGSAFDFSGVGMASGRWITMISDTYFLSANHFQPSTGTTVTFYEDNTLLTGHSYTVAGGSRVSVGGVGTDLWLGQLTASLNPLHNIATYRTLLGTPASFLGETLWNYGLGTRVGRNVADLIETDTSWDWEAMLYYYDNPGVGADETYIEPGDSGGPTFIVRNGELLITGIHYFQFTDDNGTPADLTDDRIGSGDSFVPLAFTEINSLMTGESFDAYTVPEPAAILLFAGGAALLVVVRRRRKGRRTA